MSTGNNVNALPLLLLLIGQSGYAGSPLPAIDAALQAAHVQQSDVVMDIGSGDGRVCILAAKLHGCRAIGLEFDANLAALSRRTVERNRVAHLVEIRHADALRADLSRATVVYLYHQSDFLTLLRPQLESLKPGTRIVCLDYPPPWLDLEPVTTLTVDGHEHRIYVWEVGMESRRNDSVLLACAKSYPGARFYRGERDMLLVELAQQAANLLAQRGESGYWWDGHPDWNVNANSRYQVIRSRYGVSPVEVTAMSSIKSSEITAEIAYGFFYDWYRSSSPKERSSHWTVVSTEHKRYGDAVARSRSGTWFGVVIVAD